VAVALVALLHLLEPEFDPSWRMLSEYSLGRYGVLMRVAFLAWGSGVVALAVALSAWAWPWNLGLAVVAVGPLGAAFVDTDPITTPPREMSRRGRIHAALGVLFILGFPVAATIAGVAVAGDAAGSALAWASAGPWIALAWFLLTNVRHARPDGRGAPDVPVGWPNRVSMLVDLCWVLLACVLILT
jgi:hypothetical protein